MATSPILRRCYLLLHTPVELGRPIVIHVARTCNRNDELFQQYLLNAETAHKTHQVPYLLSKSEIQKWTPYIPAGPRIQVVDLAVNETQYELLDWNNSIYRSRLK